MSTVPLLYISDGTTTVDLMGLGDSGFFYKSWTTLSAQNKSSMWAQSGLGDGRRPGLVSYENVIENIEVSVRVSSADKSIEKIRALQKLLIDATDYWGKPGTPIVYIAARSPGETNTRYAPIFTGSIPSMGPVYGQPFVQPALSTAVFETLSAVVERGHWLDVVPNESSSIGITAWLLFNAEMYGHLNYSALLDPTREETYSTDQEEVYISNGGHNANITVLMGYDASQASYTANLAGWGSDWLTGVSLRQGEDLAVGDYYLFGISSALDHASGFSSLVNWMGTGASSTTWVWEFHDGTDWRALTIFPSVATNGLSVTGKNMIMFRPTDPVTYSTWDPATINSIAAYYIRARVTVVVAAQPVFITRPPYTPAWNTVRIPGSLLKGDIGVRPKIQIQVDGEFEDVSGSDYSRPQKIIGGIKRIDRGDNFRSTLPISQRASDGDGDPIVWTASNGGAAAFVDSTFTPWGDMLQYTPADTNWHLAASLSIDSTNTERIWPDYVGSYLAFLRFYKFGTTTQFDIKIEFTTHSFYPVFERIVLNATGADAQKYGVVQFDNFILPDLGTEVPPGWTANYPSINIYVRADTGTDVLGLYDLVLIPTDEWAFTATSSLVVGGYSAPVNSTDYIKRLHGLRVDATGTKPLFRATNYMTNTGPDRNIWVADSWPSPRLRSGEDYFLSLLALQYDGASGVDKVWSSYPQQTMSISLAGAAEYAGLRGDS